MNGFEKTLLILVFFLILAVVILILLFKSHIKKYKKLEDEYIECQDNFAKVSDNCKLFKKELEIERKHKDELAKKVADVAGMPIVDVLNQLQND